MREGRTLGVMRSCGNGSDGTRTATSGVTGRATGLVSFRTKATEGRWLLALRHFRWSVSAWLSGGLLGRLGHVWGTRRLRYVLVVSDGVEREIDRPRFLAPQLGYTPNRHVAIDDLEAVDQQEQRRQTHAANREQLRRRMLAWASTRGAILTAAEQFQVSQLGRFRTGRSASLALVRSLAIPRRERQGERRPCTTRRAPEGSGERLPGRHRERGGRTSVQPGGTGRPARLDAGDSKRGTTRRRECRADSSSIADP